MIRLEPAQWQQRRAEHERRVDDLVGDHLRRRHDAVKHPVADFLFTYYSHRPAQLRRWHPGPGVADRSRSRGRGGTVALFLPYG